MKNKIYSKLGITSESARAMRMVDFIVVPIVFVAILAAFHIHFMLTAGDWDFWVDWKDKLYWPMITTISAIMFAAATQSILWRMFRLPIGATVAMLGLVLASWVTRYVQFHGWSYFPMSFVWPAMLVPSALFIDAVLMLSRNWVITAIVGGLGFAVIFPIANAILLAPFNIPVEFLGDTLTVADLMGFGYVRGGAPEYLRIIEGAGLRVLGDETLFIAVFFAGFVNIFLYALWWNVAAFMGRVFTVRNPVAKWLNIKQKPEDKEERYLEEQYPN